MTDEPRKLSNSELRSFKTCRRRWWLSYHRRLDQRPGETLPFGVMQLGSSVHLALEAHYGHGIGAIETLDLTYHDAIQAHPEFEKELRSEHAYAVTMVNGYLEWAAETGVDFEYEVVTTEGAITFEVTLPSGRAVSLVGRLDQIVRRRGGDEALLIRDWKTVGDFSKANGLLRDEQMRHYAMLQWLTVAASGSGETIDGVLYTMIKRSKRTARAAPPFFETIQVRYNATEHRSMLTRVTGTATDLLSVEEKLDAGADHRSVAYPNPGDYCGWGCAFRDVCHLADDGSRFEDALRDRYVTADPYGHYGNEKIEYVKKVLSID